MKTLELSEYPLNKAVTQFFDKAVQKYGYQVRSGQNEMASEVSRAVAEKLPLAVEAEVGTGKSYAYLVPVLIQYFRERKRDFNNRSAGTVIQGYGNCSGTARSRYGNYSCQRHEKLSLHEKNEPFPQTIG